MQQHPDDDGPAGDTAADRSLSDDLRLLAEDGKTFVASELAYQKARLAYLGKRFPAIALLIGAALVLLFFATMALTFGLVLALAPVLTTWGATAAVTGGLLIAAGISALAALVRWKTTLRRLKHAEDEP